jgi:hypothetical protein
MPFVLSGNYKDRRACCHASGVKHMPSLEEEESVNHSGNVSAARRKRHRLETDENSGHCPRKPTLQNALRPPCLHAPMPPCPIMVHTNVTTTDITYLLRWPEPSNPTTTEAC